MTTQEQMIKEPKESGYSYRAALTKSFPHRDGEYSWFIKILDNPNDPDWAAWTVLTTMAVRDIPRYPEEGEAFRSDGIIT